MIGVTMEETAGAERGRGEKRRWGDGEVRHGVECPRGIVSLSPKVSSTSKVLAQTGQAIESATVHRYSDDEYTSCSRTAKDVEKIARRRVELFRRTGRHSKTHCRKTRYNHKSRDAYGR